MGDLDEVRQFVAPDGRVTNEQLVHPPVLNQKSPRRRYVKSGMVNEAVVRKMNTLKSPKSAVVLMLLLMEQGLRNPNWTSVRGRLRSELSLDRKTIHRTFKDLQRAGLITDIQHQNGQLTLVQLNLEEER